MRGLVFRRMMPVRMEKEREALVGSFQFRIARIAGDPQDGIVVLRNHDSFDLIARVRCHSGR